MELGWFINSNMKRAQDKGTAALNNIEEIQLHVVTKFTKESLLLFPCRDDTITLLIFVQLRGSHE
jgi:hypothetical protein